MVKPELEVWGYNTIDHSEYIGSYMSTDLNILLIELVLELEKPKQRNIWK